MRKITFVLAILSACLFTTKAICQSAARDTAYKPVDFTMQLKNMHLWRGYVVSNTALADVDMHYATKNGAFKAGVWGAAGFTGVYKEFDYYLQYSKKGFTVALWDIYNFSSDATWNNEKVFDYDKYTTGHFIDLSVAYQLQGKFPLKASWATVVHGRDRAPKNDKGRYSTYVELGYPVVRNKKVNLDFGVGGAFALSPDDGSKANFYGSKPNVVNITLTASKTIKLGDYPLPVSAMLMFNPEQNIANVQLALNIF